MTDMMFLAADSTPSKARIPRKGERLELLQLRMGIRPRGTVYYSDELQILVKWDNGGSSSLRPGIDAYRIVG
jgi:hypothetical protein